MTCENSCNRRRRLTIRILIQFHLLKTRKFSGPCVNGAILLERGLTARQWITCTRLFIARSTKNECVCDLRTTINWCHLINTLLFSLYTCVCVCECCDYVLCIYVYVCDGNVCLVLYFGRMHSSLAMRKEDCNVQTRTRDCSFRYRCLLIAPWFARRLMRVRTYPVHNRRTPTPSTLRARRWLEAVSM